MRGLREPEGTPTMTLWWHISTFMISPRVQRARTAPLHLSALAARMLL
jgi:hypothetical protein